MYSILTVHLIETKFVIILLSKNTFKQYIQQMICYIILTFSATGDRNSVIMPSEMYNDIFRKENNYDFFKIIDIKGPAGKFYMHTY